MYPRILLCLFLLYLTAAPTHAADSIDDLIARLSVADKVGQLFIVPFVGTNIAEASNIWELVNDYKIGGVILLAANSNFTNDPSTPQQIADLTNSLQSIAFKANGLPLFIALDHEGDAFPYTRITGGVTPIPSQMAIGATWQPKYAEAVGQIVGEELDALGVNLLLGPNVDVLNTPRPTERGDLGIRVFGGDPYWVSLMGRAYIRGVHQGSGGHVATIAKHFPGHGGSDRLPDNEIATVDKSLQELQRIELPPFFHVMAALPDDVGGQTDGVMSSHIRYRGFQGDIRQFTAPISFDAEGMNLLFRLPEMATWRQLGGLVVSDALGVPAVRKHFDPSRQTFPHRRIAKEAFLAGNDVLSLVQFDARSVWADQFANIKDTATFFQSEYSNNPIFAKRVDEAVTRILRLKLKLNPDFKVEAFQRDPQQAMNVANETRPIINEIAQQSLTLLYPSSADELHVRLAEPPRADEQILIISDVRLSRECYTSDCPPKEMYLPRNMVQETILRFYGSQGSRQILPENISTITFSELKLALRGAIDLPTISVDEAALPAELLAAASLLDPLANTGLSPALEIAATPIITGMASGQDNPLLQLSAVEVRQKIQAAKWLIFATLDLNTRGFSDSDALKLFLSQESGSLRDKNTVVMAFNAPYYLDTTEITKLTAYYGVYSKTPAQVEAAVRALFGEATFGGHSPVSVEGIGYDLADVVAPEPDQPLAVQLVTVSPESHVLPVNVKLQVGPIYDHNGNLVPDDTPVEVTAYLADRRLDTEMGNTLAGMAQTELFLTEVGRVQIMVQAGQAHMAKPLEIVVLAPTPTPTNTPTHTPSPTATDTATPLPPSATPTATHTPIVSPTTTLAKLPPPSMNESSTKRPLDGVDLLTALGATLLAGLLGLSVGQQLTLSYQVRQGLWVLIGGLSAYLLYGAGVLRPETWFMPQPNLWVSRLSMAALAFGFSLMALRLSQVNLTAKRL